MVVADADAAMAAAAEAVSGGDAIGGTTRESKNNKSIKEKQGEEVETGNDDSHDDPQCRCMLLDVLMLLLLR